MLPMLSLNIPCNLKDFRHDIDTVETIQNVSTYKVKD